MPQKTLPHLAKLALIAFCVLTAPLVLIAQGGAGGPLGTAEGALGIFDGQQDVGTVLHPGSAQYDSASGTYTVSGSGENMWFSNDDFRFVWAKVSGDVALTADIAILGAGGDPHRKAVLMIRQSLEGNSAAVDVAVHGVGLTSLQFRDAGGGIMHEVQAHVTAPRTVRIEKRGDYFYAFVSGADGKLEPAGASTKVALTGPFYIGIGVCAHNKDVIERAAFSRVKLDHLSPAAGEPVLVSALETIPIASTDRHVEYVAANRFEAPNWSRDGASLLFNEDGKIFRLALAGGAPATIDTTSELQCNNDHGISPDGTLLAISDNSNADHQSRVYVVPIAGGTPRQLTPDGLSYWHGWSPDGKTLAFTGERNGNFDIYTIPVAGGPVAGSAETRLTTAPGLDDGPEYSPNGAWIYFNSDRTGHMQIWRMKSDGSGQEQVITDDTNDWFPHISPDGQWMVFIAYAPDVTGHPPNKDVELRLMSMTDKQVHVLTRLFGGQGTINVPSWSPDSKKLAFVSYELLPQESLNPQ